MRLRELALSTLSGRSNTAGSAPESCRSTFDMRGAAWPAERRPFDWLGFGARLQVWNGFTLRMDP